MSIPTSVAIFLCDLCYADCQSTENSRGVAVVYFFKELRASESKSMPDLPAGWCGHWNPIRTDLVLYP